MTEAMTHTTVDSHGVEHAGVHHPSDWEYIKVAMWLGLFTLIEVGTYFQSVHHAPRWSLFVLLSVLMTVKFFIVAASFMHIKYDTPWFRRVFIAGLTLAIIVYGAFLFTFDIFGLG
jgi:cytochrome c oxidase subunit IV